MKKEYLQPKLELYSKIANCGIIAQSPAIDDPSEEDIL